MQNEVIKPQLHHIFSICWTFSGFSDKKLPKPTPFPTFFFKSQPPMRVGAKPPCPWVASMSPLVSMFSLKNQPMADLTTRNRRFLVIHSLEPFVLENLFCENRTLFGVLVKESVSSLEPPCRFLEYSNRFLEYSIQPSMDSLKSKITKECVFWFLNQVLPRNAFLVTTQPCRDSLQTEPAKKYIFWSPYSLPW